MTTVTSRDFLVPDLGEGLEDATVVAWSVQVGDTVELNQVLCTLETAKAEVEIPSPFAGLVTERRGAEGDTLDVGTLLVRIEVAADDADDAPPPPPAVEQASDDADAYRQPRAPVLVGYGADEQFDRSRRRRSAAEHPRQRPRAAPAVRKLAAELRVDLAALEPGSGTGGVILREDVLAAAAGDTDEVVPVHGVRARMAKGMTLSRREIPDAHASVAVDCTNLLRLRDRMRDAVGPDGAAPTPFVLTLRLLIVALGHHRIFNASWVDSPDGPHVHVHPSINLGFAVATPRGLLVPVLTDAQTMTTPQLTRRIGELIAGARNGSLRPAELQGSTFTVSNFGALGLDEGVPVINYPEAAILGMGSLKERAVIVAGEVVARATMTLTCAFDHRIADGAEVAEFLGELARLMESPEMALLDL